MAFDSAHNMHSLHAKIIRGGSSKGIYIDVADLPPEGAARDKIVLKLFGSPDKRQIDGLGGADKLTSKVAVMGRATRADCDIDYLFGQVNTELPRVDWNANCGNLSAGAALYGVLSGLGTVEDDLVRINIHQVNTGRKLVAKVPLYRGFPAVDGDFAIGGVPGTGARIDVDFADFSGSAMGGNLLPTGNPRDTIDVPGIGGLEVSIVDMANLLIFVRATDINMDVKASIYDMQADQALVARLEAIRKAVSNEIGFISGPAADEELRVSTNPLIFAVAPPLSYLGTNKHEVGSDQHDLFSRSLARYEFSKAYPGSGAAGTAVASGIEGTIAHEAARNVGQGKGQYSLRIGHPGGVLEVAAEIASVNHKTEVRQAIIGRTARLIMDGTAYIRKE